MGDEAVDCSQGDYPVRTWVTETSSGGN